MELTQQRLLEPEPTRTVRAAEGAGHWGVDPSTLRLAIAWRTEDEIGARTRSYTRTAGPRRLAFIYAETVQFVLGVAGWVWPGYVLFEQPSGEHPNLNLVYAAGAQQAAVYAALHRCAQASGWPVPEIEVVPSATWKSVGIGQGWKRLKKADGDILRLAREDGYSGDSLDEADAHYMAKAARRTVRFCP